MRRRSYLGAVSGLTAAAATAGCFKTSTNKSLFGIVPQDNAASSIPLGDFESWVEKPPAVVTLFGGGVDRTDWIGEFVEGRMTAVWESGHVPMLTWEPFVSEHVPENQRGARPIADGWYDGQIGTLAHRLSNWVRAGNSSSRRFYFRPAHEMNANWYPWSGDPDAYVAMWHRLRDIFADVGLDSETVQWIWAPNEEDFGSSPAEAYYPGDEHVDWVGIDGYNFGDSTQGTQWRSPKEVFRPMLDRVRDLTDHPVAIPEFASTSYRDGAYHPEAKTQWIRNVLSFVTRHDIKMHCWFNLDKETDWAVFGGDRGTSTAQIDGETYNSYEAYRQGVSSNRFIGGRDGEMPRITDEQFRGTF